MREDRAMSRLVLVVLTAAVSTLMVACDGSNDPGGPPVLDRIDGPAQVDPSFDPFATAPATDVDG